MNQILTLSQAQSDVSGSLPAMGAPVRPACRQVVGDQGQCCMHFECDERFVDIELLERMLCWANVWRLIKFTVHAQESIDGCRQA